MPAQTLSRPANLPNAERGASPYSLARASHWRGRPLQNHLHDLPRELCTFAFKLRPRRGEFSRDALFFLAHLLLLQLADAGQQLRTFVERRLPRSVLLGKHSRTRLSQRIFVRMSFF